jgi:hypothetical protein
MMSRMGRATRAGQAAVWLGSTGMAQALSLGTGKKGRTLRPAPGGMARAARAFLLGAALALTAGAVAGCGGPAKATLPAGPITATTRPGATATPAGPAPSAVAPPSTPTAAGAASRLGVNYVYHELKQSVRHGGSGAPADFIRGQNQELVDLGVGWVRSAGPGDPTSLNWAIVEPQPGVFDWTLHDLRVQVAAGFSLQFLSNVDFSTVPTFAQAAGKYFDDARYLEYLSAAVERYDGDGVDDMPGLARPIKYWEIGNEVVVTRNFEGTPQDYAHVLQISYEQIKASCPDCQVLIGGWIIGKRDEAKWQQSLDYFDQVLAAGGGRYFDIMNYHEYTPGGDFLTYDHVKAFRDALAKYGLAKPMWITEGNTALTAKGEAVATLAQQAQDVVKRIVIAFDAGVDVYFWHGLDDVQGGPGVGLYNAHGTLKPNGYNLKLLIATVRGFSRVERLDLGQSDLYAYRFEVGDRQAFVLWAEGADTTIDLSRTLGQASVQLTQAIVEAEVSSYPTTTVDAARVPVTQTPAFITIPIP